MFNLNMIKRVNPRKIGRPSLASFPTDLFLRGEFKSYVNAQISQSPMGELFRPRLYTYADFVLVKFYAILTRQSVHEAAESLN